MNDQGTFLAYKNWVEEVANSGFATAAQVQGQRIAANVKTRESDDFWRFLVATGATSAVLTINFGVDREVGLVTAQFPRGTYPGVSETSPVLGATDTLRFRLLNASDAEVWDSGVDASNVVPGYMTYYHEVATPVTARKLEVTIDAASRIAAGFCDVGCLGAWPVIRTNVGFSYPAGFGWIPNVEKGVTPVGQTYTARYEPRRRWSLAFDALSNAESLVFSEMLRHSEGARQVFIKRGDLPAGYDAMHALVLSDREMESRTPELRQQALSFEEFI